MKKEPCFSFELITRLPTVAGKLTPNAPLKESTWFGVGGPAEVLFKPQDVNDLAAFLKACPKDVPLTFLGSASNILVRDGGVPGVVIRLSPAFATVRRSENRIVAGAAALDHNIARSARDWGLAGLEFFCGIPGTLGGALRMNAGAHGRETKDVVVSVTAITTEGEIVKLSPEEMGFSYRHTSASADLLFVEATLEATPDNKEAIAERMKDITDKRAVTQPIREKTGGSTFANPEGHKAWELIDKAGCRGLRIGGAVMSTQHCNFIINTGDATAQDIEALGEEVRRRVLAASGVNLRWEIQRIGIPFKEDYSGNYTQ